MRLRLFTAAFLSVQLAATLAWGRSADSSPERQRTSLPGYDLSKPTASFPLPAELAEISGLTDIDDHTIACVQDENGTIYYVDLRAGRVSRSQRFGGRGDYEGLARVGDALWVLRSDGLLHELRWKGDALVPARRIVLDVSHRDLEGLAFDPFRKVILVAPKDPPSGSKKKRGKRRVFVVDPVSGKQLETLALRTSVNRIVREAEQAGIPLPQRTNKKGHAKTVFKARFSSVAVHPRTGQLYLASAIDNTVLAFDRDGRLCATHLFDDREMPKVEGISFLANGDLVVSSEGVDAPSRIQVFRYRDSSPDGGGSSGHTPCQSSAPVGAVTPSSE